MRICNALLIGRMAFSESIRRWWAARYLSDICTSESRMFISESRVDIACNDNVSTSIAVLSNKRRVINLLCYSLSARRIDYAVAANQYLSVNQDFLFGHAGTVRRRLHTQR